MELVEKFSKNRILLMHNIILRNLLKVFMLLVLLVNSFGLLNFSTSPDKFEYLSIKKFIFF
jgi:hypothetical protein